MKYYDDEEKDFVESFDKGFDEGKVSVSSDSKAIREKMRKSAAAYNAEKKESETKKSLSIRLQESTIDKIKQQAKEEGLPYQTLISSVLFQFSQGKLQRKTSLS
jgi:predicted DNA binding CopG/RHH family protein